MVGDETFYRNKKGVISHNITKALHSALQERIRFGYQELIGFAHHVYLNPCFSHGMMFTLGARVQPERSMTQKPKHVMSILPNSSNILFQYYDLHQRVPTASYSDAILPVSDYAKYLC